MWDVVVQFESSFHDVQLANDTWLHVLGIISMSSHLCFRCSALSLFLSLCSLHRRVHSLVSVLSSIYFLVRTVFSF